MSGAEDTTHYPLEDREQHSDEVQHITLNKSKHVQGKQRLTDKQESRVHDCSSVQHGCHQNVVTRTVHKRHVSERKRESSNGEWTKRFRA